MCVWAQGGSWRWLATGETQTFTHRTMECTTTGLCFFGEEYGRYTIPYHTIPSFLRGRIRSLYCCCCCKVVATTLVVWCGAGGTVRVPVLSTLPPLSAGFWCRDLHRVQFHATKGKTPLRPSVTRGSPRDPHPNRFSSEMDRQGCGPCGGASASSVVCFDV